ncbi:hypothetical protein WJX72_004717 [[Myrmecia] bisecta]|uniref:Guanylate cyclase domain-containing protein n=1 Tax=[Myrmecia] bisecta TaxID=41462 RepID=A0AAW1QEV9_9CHLO
MELLMHPGAGASLLSVHDPLPLDPGRDPLYKQQYADASVLYCRVVGLDDVMYGTPAEDQLKWLHRLHICINSLLKQMPVMKVDLSGGVILFASGVENEDRNHADSLLQLAKTLLGAIQSMKLPDGRPLRMQMGLHSGEVASGVIGSLALRYRVYGSTVSVAKQLGAFSAPGMLRLSSESWSRLTATHGLVLADPVKLADWSQVDSYLLGSLPHFSPADLRMANAAAREGTDQARELLVFKDPRLEVPFKRLYYGPRRVPDALAFVLLLDLLLVTHRLACILLLSMPHSSRVYAYLCGNVRWGLAAWNPLLGQAGLSALHMMLWPSIPLPAGGAPASGWLLI